MHLWRRGRRTTRFRLSEAKARARLVAPERVESSLIVVDPTPHGAGWSFASGLVRRHDGAMMLAAPVESNNVGSDGALGATLGAAQGGPVSVASVHAAWRQQFKWRRPI